MCISGLSVIYSVITDSKNVPCMGTRRGGGQEKVSPPPYIHHPLEETISLFEGLFATFPPCRGLYASFSPYGRPFSRCVDLSVTFFQCGRPSLSLWGGGLYLKISATAHAIGSMHSIC